MEHLQAKQPRLLGVVRAVLVRIVQPLRLIQFPFVRSVGLESIVPTQLQYQWLHALHAHREITALLWGLLLPPSVLQERGVVQLTSLHLAHALLALQVPPVLPLELSTLTRVLHAMQAPTALLDPPPAPPVQLGHIL